MKVIDLIKNSPTTAFSFEVLPPLKGNSIEKVFNTIDTLREFDPKYINITTHRSEFLYKDMEGGLYKRVAVRPRPGSGAGGPLSPGAAHFERKGGICAPGTADGGCPPCGAGKPVA